MTALKAIRRDRLVVFTNGCFDLLHTGHTTYLAQARSLGDILVVGVNSDGSAGRLDKGPGRPIRNQQQRAEILAALESVSLVTIFDEETPLELISLIRPQILVKGGDWPPETIVGAEVVKADGGKVLSLPYLPGESTTELLDRIRSGP